MAGWHELLNVPYHTFNSELLESDIMFIIALYFILGTTLSQDAIIAVTSTLMITVLTICSIVFFIFGYFCGRYRKLQEQNPVARPPVYEDILPHHHTEDQHLELKSNVAYAKPVIK